MFDASGSDEGGPSGVYEVDDVDAFHATNRDTVDWVEPEDLGLEQMNAVTCVLPEFRSTDSVVRAVDR